MLVFSHLSIAVIQHHSQRQSMEENWAYGVRGMRVPEGGGGGGVAALGRRGIRRGKLCDCILNCKHEAERENLEVKQDYDLPKSASYDLFLPAPQTEPPTGTKCSKEGCFSFTPAQMWTVPEE